MKTLSFTFRRLHTKKYLVKKKKEGSLFLEFQLIELEFCKKYFVRGT